MGLVDMLWPSLSKEHLEAESEQVLAPASVCTGGRAYFQGTVEGICLLC